MLQQIVNSFALGSVYVLVALGLFLVFSTLHIPNFAHGEMFALGAFLQHWLVVSVGWDFWAALAVVTLATALAGAALMIGVFRRLREVGFLAMFLGSLALAIVLQETIGLVWGKDPLGMTAPVGGVSDIAGVRISNYRLVVIVFALAIALCVGALVFRTVFGRNLRAMAQNSEISALTGINVQRVGVTTFGLGAGLAGLAGALLAPTTVLHPHIGFHLTMVSFIVLVIVGGAGRMSAVIFAAMILATLETVTVGYIDSGLKSSVVFLVLIAFLLVRPEGARSTSAAKVRL